MARKWMKKVDVIGRNVPFSNCQKTRQTINGD